MYCIVLYCIVLYIKISKRYIKTIIWRGRESVRSSVSRLIYSLHCMYTVQCKSLKIVIVHQPRSRFESSLCNTVYRAVHHVSIKNKLIAHKNSLEIFKYLLYAILYKDKTNPLPKTERRLANNTVGNVKQT